LVAILSNFLFRRDPGESPGELICRPAWRDELSAGLRIILAASSRPADDEQILDFLRLAVQRGIDLNRMWLAERKGKLLWALLPIVSPGRTMLLLAPSIAPPNGEESAARTLIGRVVEHYSHQEVRLAQVLLDPSDSTAHRLFVASGFQRLAELVYLQKVVRGGEQPPALPPGTSLSTYSPETHDLFARTIVASYENSLDCPALNGLRNIEDVIAGHKATGEHDPRLWFLLSEGAEPAGALLLSRTPRTDALELVYLGVSHRFRGKGYGDLLVRHALAMAAREGLSRLTLAVDGQNPPALRVYYRNGLSRLCTRIALLKELPTA
jgi:mycothiol synthase